MPPRRGAPQAGPPPLLPRIYGGGAVMSLHDLLLQLGGCAREVGRLGSTLVSPTDPPEYRLGLLARTWCTLQPGAPPLRAGFTLQQASSQQEVRGRCAWP